MLAQRVLEHPDITVLWNKTVVRFDGRAPNDEEEEEDAGLTGIRLRDTTSGDETTLQMQAAFVAIGHDPNTGVFKGHVGMDDKTGYINVAGYSTVTDTPGVFACGDVADSVYRQAITSAGSGAMAALDAERWLSEQPPLPPPASPGDITSCDECVASGFGWNDKKSKCGPGFRNRVCE